MRPLFPLTKPTFFFQAADGIRVIGVTGVQTCALPICILRVRKVVCRWGNRKDSKRGSPFPFCQPSWLSGLSKSDGKMLNEAKAYRLRDNDAKKFSRSEERRVGKECRSRWWEQNDERRQ